jgi:hypothetical protein
MKIPQKHSRARAILETLLSEPATIYQGIERHGLMGVGEQNIRNLYQKLEVDQCVVKNGLVYIVTERARAELTPVVARTNDAPPTEPAYRGNWQIGALTAATARRAGAAFGLDWIRP